MRLRSLALFLLSSLLLPPIAAAQGLRFGDQNPIQRTTLVSGYSGYFVTALQGTINFCAFPANAVPCTNKVITYTDVTLSTPCSTSVQLTIANSNSCVGISDAFGNWGVWAPVGNYTYTYTIGGQSYGPFLATASVGSGNLPPGLNKQCVFNDNGAYGANVGCSFDKASGNLTLAGNVTAAGFVSTATGSFFVNSPFGATAKAPVAGQNGITFDTAAGILLCSANGAAYATCGGGGGGGSPGGASGTLQYNNAGAFGGITGSAVDGSFNVTLPAKLKMSATAANIYGPSLTLSGSSTPFAAGATESSLVIAGAGSGFQLVDGTGKGIQSDGTNVQISNGSTGSLFFPHSATFGAVGSQTGKLTYVGLTSGSHSTGCSNATCDQLTLDATGNSVNIIGGLNFNSTSLGITGYGSTASGTVLGAGTVAGSSQLLCTDGSGTLTITTSGCPGSTPACGFASTGTASSSGSNTLSGTANRATLWGFFIPTACVTTQFDYAIATADNTANTYDIGVYQCTDPCSGSTGTLKGHFTAAGTTFAPNTNLRAKQNWASSFTLTPGRYYLALTSNCVAACATLYGFNAVGNTYVTNAVVTVSSGGTLPATVTLPSDAPSVTASLPSIIFY